MDFSVSLSRLIACLSLLLLLLALAACERTPVRPGERIEGAQDVGSAYRMLEKASSSTSPDREILQLQAAMLLADNDESLKAEKVLSGLDAGNLPDREFALYSLFRARLLVQADEYDNSLTLLTSHRIERLASHLESNFLREWRLQRAELFSLLGENRLSIGEYVELSRVVDEKSRQKVHNRLWAVLGHMPQYALKQAAEETPEETARGWYQLALSIRSTRGEILQQLAAIEDWQKQWPRHPATLYPPKSFTLLRKLSTRIPSQVALLLPLQGSLAVAGQTIRDGFVSAYYDSLARHGTTPSVKFYDTAAGTDVERLYQQAVADGAQITIGPLQKEQVRQLLDLEKLTIPVLALNYLAFPIDGPSDRQIPDNLFQFGLSPEDEARQVADRAWLEGHRIALGIAPNTSWGQRAMEAFRETWETRGGTLISTPGYPADQVDFSSLLKPALHIERSEQRHQRLERTLGRKLDFTPRRRQDLDMVFLLAYPDTARQINPTLDFYFATDLKVYGTSYLYAGIADEGYSQDLEGVEFLAMPWTLPGGVAENLKPDENLPPAYRHLFGLGVDAYRLLQHLEQMRVMPDTRLFGNTGSLSLDANGAIRREQPWAEFFHGSVRPLPSLSSP